MRRYVTILLTIVVLATGSLATFNTVVDPYGIYPDIRIAGINARRTRAHEDGYRVYRARRLRDTDAGTIILGSSRVVDGFPATLPEWPGGLENMGLAGASGYELARASILAAQNDNIRCVVVGLDLREFGPYGKAHGTTWLTAMSGVPAILADARAAISPTVFSRALQTLNDNATGGQDDKWATAYAPERLPARFAEDVVEGYRHFRSYRYDPEKLAFLLRAIDGLLMRGVQVVVFIHPIHAWQEESAYRLGVDADKAALRRGLAEWLGARTDEHARAPCFPGPQVQAWSFEGFQDVALTAPPGSGGFPENPWYYNASHYRPNLGGAILTRLLGGASSPPVDAARFGERIELATLDAIAAAANARRAAWIASGSQTAIEIDTALDRLASEPPPEEHQVAAALGPEDWRQLERDLRAIARRPAP